MSFVPFTGRVSCVSFAWGRSGWLNRESCEGQRSSAPSLLDPTGPTVSQQRPLRSVGLGILESFSSFSGPVASVATVPLSGAQMQPPHGINVNPEISKGPKVRHSGQRQVKDNFVNRVVEKCGPAVVRIQTEQKVEVPAFTNLFVCFVELVVVTCFQYVFIYLSLFVFNLSFFVIFVVGSLCFSLLCMAG